MITVQGKNWTFYFDDLNATFDRGVDSIDIDFMDFPKDKGMADLRTYIVKNKNLDVAELTNALNSWFEQ